MKNRLIGIDVARALAVIGMIIVNFKIAIGEAGDSAFKVFAGLFEGKAAATFVVLAGVGLAFMSNSAVKNNNRLKLKKARTRIAKRAIFLFVVGLMYTPIWIADILHFYGIYMLISLLVLSWKPKWILAFGAFLVIIYPFMMIFWNYDAGWNFQTFEYTDFWTFSGFIRNLFYNGFHPVIPWTAFMLLGLWFGKQNLSDTKFLKTSLIISLVIFVSALLVSKGLIYLLSEGNKITMLELSEVLGTSPMPPFPIYMISGSSVAIFIITSCLFISRKLENNLIIKALYKTGQLALTFYVAHVVIGMGIIEVIDPKKMGSYSIDFSVIYALLFSLICIIFAWIWTKYRNNGPLEWLLRKIAKQTQEL